MKKAPNIVNLRSVLDSVNSTQTEINGNWVPARPLGFYSIGYRLKAAWLVFTGQCDALKWPKGQ